MVVVTVCSWVCSMRHYSECNALWGFSVDIWTKTSSYCCSWLKVTVFITVYFLTHSVIRIHIRSQKEVISNQGSQNFKIPGTTSGRYSSDFGSPKIYLTSPKKINKYIYIYIYRKSDRRLNHSKIFSIHKYQQIWRKEFYFTIYRVSAELKNKFTAIYDPF